MMSRNYTFIDVIIVVFLIVTSGYLGVGSITNITIPLFVISVLLFVYHKEKLSNLTIGVLVLFFFLMLLQRLKWAGSIGNVMNVELQLISYALLASCVSRSFLRLFPKMVFVIAAISMFFYIIDHAGGHGVLLYIAKNFPIRLENQNDTMDAYSFLLYVVDADAGIRNCGPFFEPGRYAVVLVIAYTLNLVKNQSLFGRDNVVILLALISTVSLSGLATLFVVLSVFLFTRKNKAMLGFVPILLLIIVYLFPLFMQSDYFGGKLMTNYETNDNSNSRFGAFVYLWLQTLQSPFVGYGPSIFLLEDFDVFNVSSPNGIGELLRYWGIPMTVFYLVLLYRSGKTMGLAFARGGQLMVFLSIVLVSFSQSVTLTPLYYTFIFLGTQFELVKKSNETNLVSLVNNVSSIN